MWRDPPAGSARTHARLDGPLTVEGWLDAVRRGRAFATTGPLLFIEVDGRPPGDEIRVGGGAPTAFPVSARGTSVTPIDSLQVPGNGEVARTVRAGEDRLQIVFEGEVEAPRGGWIAARVLGPSSPYIGDDYAFAQTSPVYVV